MRRVEVMAILAIGLNNFFCASTQNGDCSPIHWAGGSFVEPSKWVKMDVGLTRGLKVFFFGIALSPVAFEPSVPKLFHLACENLAQLKHDKKKIVWYVCVICFR